MIHTILVGCRGTMGKVIKEATEKNNNFNIIAGVDRPGEGNFPFPVFEKLENISQKADILIDFSHPSMLDTILTFGEKTNTPLVLCTTGYSDAQKVLIETYGKENAVFFSANMSLGVNLLAELAKTAAAFLGDDFDIEIVEKHHNQKIDAPSGTALLLADQINEVRDNQYRYEYNRHSKRMKRDKHEIGIHAVRGGTIVGEHDIIFAGTDEVITLSHAAFSKQVFATGALNAAKFMVGKTKGLFSMKDLMK